MPTKLSAAAVPCALEARLVEKEKSVGRQRAPRSAPKWRCWCQCSFSLRM